MGTSLADVVSANIRRMRDIRGMTVRELSARLGALGHPILASGITKAEYAASQSRSTTTEKERRRIDVDDLAAIALALETSPAYLMAPATQDDVEIVPARTASAWWVSEWARGESPLPDDDEERFLATAPESLRRRRQAGLHPAMRALESLSGLARTAVLAEPGATTSGRPLADALRQDLARVVRYIELLADEEERRDE